MNSVIETPFGIRWTSLATAIAIVVLIGAIRRRPLLGVVTAMGWGTTFEVAFQITGILTHPDAHWMRTLASESWWLWTVVGWSLAAHLAGVRPHLAWLAATSLLWVLWVQQGFWFNWQSSQVNWWWETLNVSSKTALAVAYLLGALAPERSGWRECFVICNRLRRVLPERPHGSNQTVR